ncbi:urokinase-type plasminogen activator-like [Oratosquilla oratoria]|uniref:urokinase-type plasminogen activator-like n=1 Tax=Oratosquilla oratoria TaxID=337810 RepID=UPI003F75FCE0
MTQSPSPSPSAGGWNGRAVMVEQGGEGEVEGSARVAATMVAVAVAAKAAAAAADAAAAVAESYMDSTRLHSGQSPLSPEDMRTGQLSRQIGAGPSAAAAAQSGGEVGGVGGGFGSGRGGSSSSSSSSAGGGSGASRCNTISLAPRVNKEVRTGILRQGTLAAETFSQRRGEVRRSSLGLFLPARPLFLLVVAFLLYGHGTKADKRRLLDFTPNLDLLPQLRHGGYPKFLPEDNEFSIFGSSCGTRSVSPHSRKASTRIVGGNPAPYGAYPWTVRLEKSVSSGRPTGHSFKHHCGGTIVSERHIITAAHCLESERPQQLRAKIGDDKLHETEAFEQIFEVEKWRIHPNYKNGGIYTDDIAVIKIAPKQGSGIKFNSHVRAACLPSSSTQYVEGTYCSVTGWGSMDPDNIYNTSDSLQAIRVPLVSDKVCQDNEVHGPKRLTPGMVCAGHMDGRSDACIGDSGGPLICEIDGLQTLMGLVSWGEGCATRNKPGVYSKVRYFLPFLESCLNEL